MRDSTSVGERQESETGLWERRRRDSHEHVGSISTGLDGGLNVHVLGSCESRATLQKTCMSGAYGNCSTRPPLLKVGKVR